MFDLMNATLTPAASLALFLYDEFLLLLIYLSALGSSCRVSEESESHHSSGS